MSHAPSDTGEEGSVRRDCGREGCQRGKVVGACGGGGRERGGEGVRDGESVGRQD